LREAFFGNAAAAQKSPLAALKLSKGRDVKYGATFALSLSGDSSRAQSLVNDVETRFPEDTAVQFSYLPALRGLLSISRVDPAKAIDALQNSTPYELGQPPSNFFGFFGVMYPVL
jgi:hypothetical protein